MEKYVITLLNSKTYNLKGENLCFRDEKCLLVFCVYVIFALILSVSLRTQNKENSEFNN
jgi:hypothetical protein